MNCVYMSPFSCCSARSAVHWIAGRSVDAALSRGAFILASFGCVVLHQLGHSHLSSEVVFVSQLTAVGAQQES